MLLRAQIQSKKFLGHRPYGSQLPSFPSKKKKKKKKKKKSYVDTQRRQRPIVHFNSLCVIFN